MIQTGTIKELNEQERPYEKCMRFGAEHLTDRELLAILIRSGSKGESALTLANKILFNPNKPQGLLALHHWKLEELTSIKGMGKVKAIQILTLCELAKRLSKQRGNPGLEFTSARAIAEYYMEDMRHLEQEQVRLLMLNTKSKLIGVTVLSKGSVNSSIVTPRELFIEALQKNAVSVILMHNHPSGDPAPSKSDILLTRRVQDAGALIGIELLDHIIIGDHCFYSFAEESHIR